MPDGYKWHEFQQQVKTKLRIPGIKDIFLAAVRCAVCCAAARPCPPRLPLHVGRQGIVHDPCARALRLQSGQKVTSLDDLQDIDELCVVEVRCRGWQVAPSGMAGAEPTMRTMLLYTGV